MRREEFMEIIDFERNSKKASVYSFVIYETESVLSVMRHPYAVYLVFFILVSLGGLLISPFWYPLQLFDSVVSLFLFSGK